MQSSSLSVLGSSLLSLGFALSAFAAPVNYQEQFSGDLKGDWNTPTQPTPTNFVLDVGQNLIAGTVTDSGVFTSDTDNFSITIPAGLTLLGGGLVLNDESATGDFTSAQWSIYLPGPNDINNSKYIASYAAPSPGSVSIPALAAGTYDFQNDQLAANGIGQTPSADWAFTFNVATSTGAGVPEPTSLALFSLGGATLLRRRR